MMIINNYDEIVEKSKPHDVFSSGWSNFSTHEFGTTFLPNANIFRCNHLSCFDAAALISSVEDKSTIQLSSKTFIKASFFSFAKDSLAASSFKKIKVEPSEIVCYVQVDNQNKTTFSVLFGIDVKRYYNLKLTEQSFTNRELSLLELREIFKPKLSIDSLLDFATKFLGEIRNAVFAKDFKMICEDLYKNVSDLDGLTFEPGKIRDTGSKSWAHGDISERALKAHGYTEIERSQCYYGNWLRDYSSLITGETIGFLYKDRIELLNNEFEIHDFIMKSNKSNLFFWKPTRNTFIKIIELMAAIEFVANPKGKTASKNINEHLDEFVRKYERPDRDIVGFYLPEEHIDNPKQLKDYSILSNNKLSGKVVYKYKFVKDGQLKTKWKSLYSGESKDSLLLTNSKMKAFIKEDIDNKRPSSLTYVKEQLRLAKHYGRNKTGLRHFGAALHVIEDYYAHSNFVEIALIKVGYVNVYPWVDLSSEVQSIEKGDEKASEIPVVTGYFGQLDIVASLAPKLAKKFSTDFQESVSLKSGDRTLTDEIILLILSDFIQKEQGMDEKNKFSYLGIGFGEMKWAYLLYLDYLDFNRMLNQATELIPGVKWSRSISEYISKILKFLPNLVLSLLIDSLYDAVQLAQHSNIIGTDPSHTQLAKDHEEHHFNDLAGTLAFKVVSKIGEDMVRCWKGEKSVEEIIERVETRYFVHPNAVDWQDKYVKEWAESNKNKVKKGESKTVYDHGTDVFEQLKKKIDENIQKYK